MSREVLLGQVDDAHQTARAYLRAKPNEELQTRAPGWGGRYSRHQCIQIALMDNVRHLGEVYSLKARWEREGGACRPAGAPAGAAHWLAR